MLLNQIDKELGLSSTLRKAAPEIWKEMLALITEDVRQTFFQLWGRKLVEGDHLCCDITAVSSYARQNEYVRYGYNRDREALPQIHLAMVYGQKSCLPVTCRELPGSITDVTILANLLHQF